MFHALKQVSTDIIEWNVVGEKIANKGRRNNNYFFRRSMGKSIMV